MEVGGVIATIDDLVIGGGEEEKAEGDEREGEGDREFEAKPEGPGIEVAKEEEAEGGAYEYLAAEDKDAGLIEGIFDSGL